MAKTLEEYNATYEEALASFEPLGVVQDTPDIREMEGVPDINELDIPEFSQSIDDTEIPSLSPYEQLMGTFGERPVVGGPPARATMSEQLGAGIDLGQALLWEGAQALSTAAGYKGSDFQTYAKEQATANMLQVEQVPALTFMDQVIRGFGTAGMALAGAGIGAAAAAATPIAGLTGTMGAMGAGALMSAGMNLGDIQMKANDLAGEDVDVGGQEVALASALGLLELAPVGKFLSVMNKAAPGLKQSAMKTLGNAGKTVAMSGATEGVQDALTNVKAYHLTDTPITEEAVGEIVDQAIDEALVGAVIAVPFGGIQAGVEYIESNRPDRVKVEIDPDTGEETLKYVNAPVDDVLKEPGLLKTFAARTMGRSTDAMAMKFGKLEKGFDLFSDFVQNPTERARLQEAGVQKTTIDIQEQLEFADLQNAGRGIVDAPDAAVEQAVQLRRKGISTSEDAEVQGVLDSIKALDEYTKKRTGELGFADEVNWRGEDWVPLMNADFDSISKNTGDFIQQANLAIDATIADPAGAARAKESVKDYAENVKKNGRFIYANETSAKISDRLFQRVEEWVKAPPGKKEKKAKTLNKIIRGVGAVSRKDNALEQERALSFLPEEFWNNWTKSGKRAAKDNYLAYMKSTASRMAVVDKMGVNNEKYWQKVADLLGEAAEKGVEVSDSDLNGFVKLANVAQKLPTYRLTPRMRQISNNIRAFQNVTKLGLALIPSLAEMMFVTNKFGTGTSLSNLGKLIGMRAYKSGEMGLPKNASQARMQQLVNDLGMSMHEATSVLLNRIADDTFNPSVLEQKFFNLTMLPQFTELTRMTAAVSAEKSLFEAVQMMNSSDKRKVNAAVQKIVEAGLDPNQLRKWYTTEGPTATDSQYYRDQIRPALLAMTEDVVVNPTAVKKPFWFADERLQLVAQMKSFATVFTNGIMRTWYDRVALGANTPEKAYYLSKIFPLAATFVAAQIALGGFRAIVKDPTGEGLDDWLERDLWDSILAGVGYLGMPGMVLESSRAATYGSSPVESLAGATVGDFAKVMGSLGRAMGDPDGAMEQLTKDAFKMATPNMPGIKFIENLVLEAFE